MLDLSPEKIFVLAIVALVVLGPQRLPQAARTLGRLIGQLRSLSSTVQDEVREALHEPAEAFGAAIPEFQTLRPGEMRRSVRQAVADTLSPQTTTAPVQNAAVVPTPVTTAGYAIPAPGHPDDPGFN